PSVRPIPPFHLEDHDPVLVAVEVIGVLQLGDGDWLRRFGLSGLGRIEIDHPQIESVEDLLCLAVCKAMQQHAPVASNADFEVLSCPLVGGASCTPLPALSLAGRAIVAAEVPQRIKDRVHQLVHVSSLVAARTSAPHPGQSSSPRTYPSAPRSQRATR